MHKQRYGKKTAGLYRKFWKRWEYQTTWPASWEICTQVKKKQLEPDMEKQTGSKSGKEYIKAVYCHHAYLYVEYIMRNARLDEAQAGIKIVGTNTNNLIYCPYGRKWRGIEESLDESVRGEWKKLA